MAREIPEAVRAVAGLAATVLDEARKLPETLPGLPIRVLGVAMQMSMKLQQHYAGLVARGDELFTGIRGENEPGLATFDEEEPAASGFRDSAFDRAGAASSVEDLELTDAETADAVEAAGFDLSLQVEATAEVLEEFAIDELVDQGTPAEGTATEDATAVENALLESDRTTLEAAVEETAVEEAPAPSVTDTAGDAEASARAAAAAPLVVHEGEIAVDDALGSGDAETAGATAAATAEEEVRGAAGQRLSAPATAPVEGYDDFSIAQLRGRLRGYAAPTVQQLLDYEEATQAREPYLRMLRNRLEKLAGA